MSPTWHVKVCTSTLFYRVISFALDLAVLLRVNSEILQGPLVGQIAVPFPRAVTSDGVGSDGHVRRDGRYDGRVHGYPEMLLLHAGHPGRVGYLYLEIPQE